MIFITVFTYKAVFTPVQHVARQHCANEHVAQTSNMLPASSNMLPGNMLPWCKCGLTPLLTNESKVCVYYGVPYLQKFYVFLGKKPRVLVSTTCIDWSLTDFLIFSPVLTTLRCFEILGKIRISE